MLRARQPTEIPHVARLFQIIARLRARKPGQKIGRAELADECGCHPRTIQRDIELLQEYAHLPLTYDRAAHTYLLTEADWTYPVAQMGIEDILGLALARRLLTSPGFPHKQEILKALDNATAGLPRSLRRELAQMECSLQAEPLDRNYSRAPVSPLMAAASEQKVIEIEYQSRSAGVLTARRVDPYQIALRGGQYWEMHGWCHIRQGIRTFALDQIRQMTVTGETFTVREAEWAAFRSTLGVIGGIRGGAAVAVHVRFDPAVAAYVLDRQWPETLQLTAQADGSVQMTGTVQGTEGLLVELLAWRRHAQVLGGPELRACLADEIQAMSRLYHSDNDFEK